MVSTFGGPSALPWFSGPAGAWQASPDNTYNIGKSGANRPATGFFGTSLVIGDAVTSYAVSTPQINGQQVWNAAGVTFTGWLLNVTNTASASSSKLIDLQLGGASQFNVTRGSIVNLTNGSSLVFGARSLIKCSANGQLQFSNSSGSAITTLVTGALTVATLPSAASAGASARAFVTDSTVAAATNFGVAVVGGGANSVPVWTDGVTWYIG